MKLVRYFYSKREAEMLRRFYPETRTSILGCGSLTNRLQRTADAALSRHSVSCQRT